MFVLQQYHVYRQRWSHILKFPVLLEFELRQNDFILHLVRVLCVLMFVTLKETETGRAIIKLKLKPFWFCNFSTFPPSPLWPGPHTYKRAGNLRVGILPLLFSTVPFMPFKYIFEQVIRTIQYADMTIIKMHSERYSFLVFHQQLLTTETFYM